jgi:hypothetical protein
MAIPVTFIGDQRANQINAGSGYPKEIPYGQFQKYEPIRTDTSLVLSSFFWRNTPVKAGQIFKTTQGKRLVLEGNNNRVIYILINSKSKDNNKVFIQTPEGFAGDITTYPVEKAGENLQTTKKIAEYEVQFLVGVISGTSWTGFFTVLGVDALEFTINNKDKFAKWNEITKVCLKTRSDLKQYAPTLYDKLIYTTLLSAWKGTQLAADHASDIAENMVEAALKDPKIIGRGTGVIAAKLGMQGLNGRISILSAVWTILLTVVTKALASIPGAVKLTADDIKALSPEEKVGMAKKIVEMMRNVGVVVTKSEAEQIIDEVQAHPQELKETLSVLANTFMKNQTK